MSEIRVRRPDEGWLPLALVTFMALLVAWAIDEPGWVNGKGTLTDGLPLFAMLGVAIGVAGPKLGWGRWTTHLVGAAFAGLLIPIFAGWAKHPDVPLAEAFTATASGTVDAYLDIAWRGLRFTNEEIHYILVFGILVWATAQFGAYAVFGHRRPLNAVVVMGLVLVGNMALTSRDQLPHLIAFTGASLFLLIGMHAFDERTTWIRRRIGDPGTISALYLRGGTVFIVIALFSSLVLTQRAASNPLAGAWDGIDNQLIDMAETVSRWFPTGGDFKGGGGVSFGDTVRIGGRWYTDSGVAFRANVPDIYAGTLYWRAATYDRFDLGGWSQTGYRDVDVGPDQSLLVGTPEDPNPAMTLEVTVTVTTDTYNDAFVLSPATPVKVGTPTSVRLSGPGGWFAGVLDGGGKRAYTLTARVLDRDNTDVISGNRLLAAPETYPAEITAAYTHVPEGSLGPDARELLEQIRATAESDDPWHLANAMEAFLRDGSNFTYDPDVTDVMGECDSNSAVECFARQQRGYCLHYASTMAMLLRAANPDNPIPTRVVQGFLPGTIEARGVETVTNLSAHMWVEVYFPGYGWIPFDPTGGGVARQVPIEPGPEVSIAPSAPAPTLGPDEPDPTRQLGGDTGGATPPGSGGGGPTDRTLLIVLTLVLATAVGGAVLAAWLRGPRGEISPDRAWFNLARAASRLGFAPRPTQTVYEYAATLGELVPVAKPDLRTVAEAKVETSYARVRLGGDRLRAVRDATRRLRLSMLRLALRRGARRRKG
ncbi:MAG: transglutaminase domain-containing protein [Chloroflexota bacterium]